MKAMAANISASQNNAAGRNPPAPTVRTENARIRLSRSFGRKSSQTLSRTNGFGRPRMAPRHMNPDAKAASAGPTIERKLTEAPHRLHQAASGRFGNRQYVQRAASPSGGTSASGSGGSGAASIFAGKVAGRTGSTKSAVPHSQQLV